MENPLPCGIASNPVEHNIDAIAKLEGEALNRRTLAERARDSIAKSVGNRGFLLAQLVLILDWSVINRHRVPGVKAFDPFPFGVLALVVSSEGVFLTLFVLLPANLDGQGLFV
jgi:uncharacterized membrane protein